jgi:hypothetical protein
VSIAGEEHAVGAFGSNGLHPAFGNGVTKRRQLHPIPMVGNALSA